MFLNLIFEVTTNTKHRTILMILYSGGLRLSEVVRLKISDIDSQRMLIRINQGKGKKDRYTLLSQRMLVQLRFYYKIYRPMDYLFSGVPPDTCSFCGQKALKELGFIPRIFVPIGRSPPVNVQITTPEGEFIPFAT